MAREAKVGEHTVRRVITVVDKGVPALQNMMMTGKLSARAAEDFVRKVPIKEQNTIIKCAYNLQISFFFSGLIFELLSHMIIL